MLSFKQYLIESKNNKYFAGWELTPETHERLEGFYNTHLRDHVKHQPITVTDAGRVKTVVSPHKLHVTAMYQSNPPEDAQHPESLPIGHEHDARASHVEYWDGHDNTGYLVLRLKNDPTLQHFHDEHLASGFSSKFPDYKPHITLMNPMQQPNKNALEDMSEYVHNMPLGLKYFGQR